MGDEEEADTTKLAEAVNAAKALNEADYTKESWDAMQVELREAQDALSTPGSAASVAEATDHLNAAMAALVKVSTDDGSTSDTEASGTDSSDTAGSSEASSTDSTSSLQRVHQQRAHQQLRLMMQPMYMRGSQPLYLQDRSLVYVYTLKRITEYSDN